jgi:hypothetical protein
MKYYKITLKKTGELVSKMADTKNPFNCYSADFILSFTGFFKHELSIKEITLEEFNK